MKKPCLILFIMIFVSALCAGYEGGSDLEITAPVEPELNIFEYWQIGLDEHKIPGIPALFFARIGSKVVGAGFLISSPESFAHDSVMYTFMEELPLFEVALHMHSDKLNVTLLFNYYRRENHNKNGIWGISAAFSF